MPRKRKGKAPARAYARLARHERNTIELMLDRGASCRAIAGNVHLYVGIHKVVVASQINK